MYGSGKKQIKQVTVGLYQSITKNIEAFHDVELVVCDENQTLGAGSLMEITRGLGHVPYFYSVSATNYRADGRTLEIYAASGHVKYSFDTVRAIKEGWLAQPLFVMRDVPSAGGNYELKQKNYTDHVVKNETLNERIVKDARVMLDAHRSTLILVQEIEHGEILASKLNLPFANGENKDAMKLVEDLNRGKIKGLIAGAQMCGIGVDTVRVDCLIMASFPGTEGLTTQLIGRGLRKYEGKKMVVVLDYRVLGNNMLRRHADNRVEWYSKYGFVKEITVNAT
jgi:superfamily II DNA or RNA helicase